MILSHRRIIGTTWIHRYPCAGAMLSVNLLPKYFANVLKSSFQVLSGKQGWQRNAVIRATGMLGRSYSSAVCVFKKRPACVFTDLPALCETQPPRAPLDVPHSEALSSADAFNSTNTPLYGSVLFYTFRAPVNDAYLNPNPNTDPFPIPDSS